MAKQPRYTSTHRGNMTPQTVEQSQSGYQMDDLGQAFDAPRVVNAEPVKVTAERLPAASRTTSFTPGAEDKELRSQLTREEYGKGSFGAAKRVDERYNAAHPGTVSETSKSLITGRSITQSGLAGSDYTPSELTEQGHLTAEHQGAIANLRGNVPMEPQSISRPRNYVEAQQEYIRKKGGGSQ